MGQGTGFRPLSALSMAVLSVPLAFVRQLCVPALLMAVLALLLLALGKRKANGALTRWTAGIALSGALCAAVMWLLWYTRMLP